MKGYPQIGAIYSLIHNKIPKSLLWAVTENDSINKTSTVTVIEDCPEKGYTATVNAQWLYSREPVGPIMTPNGEIVIENGREFIKPLEKEEEQNTTMSLM